MLIDVVMPQMGESLAEGTVVRWIKKAGDRVERDEPLFEISTDKVDTEVPAPTAGTLTRILVQEGETVDVGVRVAVIDDGAAAVEEAAPSSVGAVLPPSRDALLRTGQPRPSEDSGGHFKNAHAPQLVSFRRDQASGPPSGGSGPAKAGPHDSSRPGPAKAGPHDLSRSGPAQVPPQPTRFAGRGGASAPPAEQNRSFSPGVLSAARQGGVGLDALTTMQGSGRGGRVTKADVARFLASGGGSPSGTAATRGSARSTETPREYLYRPTADDRITPMSPVRRKIADHMTWSTRISPHATAFAECDMTGAVALVSRERNAFARRVGAPLTFTALVAEAFIRTLREFPVFNASVVDDAIVTKPRVHLGVAVALPESDELVVPVVHGADDLSLEGMAVAIADVATRARERKLKVEDVQGGTVTLTNPGIFGGLTGTPILNQPQVAILGLGAIVKRAVVLDDDSIVPRSMMTLSLTFDHRAADGMGAFKFLGKLKARLEAIAADS